MSQLPPSSQGDQTSTPAHGSDGDPIRVMLVDDSAVIRGMMSRILSVEPRIEIACSVGDGQKAIDALQKSDIDVIILDIEMPVMDGLTALPKLLAIRPSVQVLVSSTLSQRNARISMEALQRGASDYLEKPRTSAELSSKDGYGGQLLQRVIALASASKAGKSGEVYTRKPTPPPAPAARAPAAPAAPEPSRPISGASASARSASPAPPPPESHVESVRKRERPGGSEMMERVYPVRRPSTARPEIVVIGGSTGGPRALTQILGDIEQVLPVPVVVTQHMPPYFTQVLADQISSGSRFKASEASNGDRLMPGHVHVTPGDYHLEIVLQDGAFAIALNQNPPENFCRPSVDPLFRSAASLFGNKVLAVMLTGMGVDGLDGSRKIAQAGGTIVTQDERTSIVWGMPGAVVKAGLSCAILPVFDIGLFLQDSFTGDS